MSIHTVIVCLYMKYIHLTLVLIRTYVVLSGGRGELEEEKEGSSHYIILHISMSKPPYLGAISIW